jgi:hypothetical protein
MDKNFGSSKDSKSVLILPLALVVVEVLAILIFVTKYTLQKHNHAATCGLYYKHMMIVNDDYSIVSK